MEIPTSTSTHKSKSHPHAHRRATSMSTMKESSAKSHHNNRKEQLHRVELTPDFVINKIVQHSRDYPTSSPRLLKYLLHVKKTFSSSNLKLWMDLRIKGGVQGIESVIRSGLRNNLDKKNVTLEESFLPSTKIAQDIFSCSLSILGNSYSLDYCARKDVASSNFIAVLHKLVQISGAGGLDKDFQDCSRINDGKELKNATIVEPPFSSIECDIKTKAVKCIANLAHDTNCRDAVLKSGVGITILKVLEKFNVYWNSDKAEQELEESKNENETKKPRRSTKAAEEFSECAKSSVRAIRILSSESRSEEAKSHLIRFGAVLTIGQILNWAQSDDLILDVIRALASLTDKIRLLPSEQVHELVSEDGDNQLLKVLITILDKCSVDAKWFCPIIRCLTNFAGNTRLAETMGRHMVFRVVLEKLGCVAQKSSTEICRLLITLTKHSSVNRCLLYNCHEVWNTLQILRCDGLQEHHRWLLHVYENVYEGCLKSLLRNGLIELIHEHFKKELEDCDYDILKSKVMSLDETICRVHGENCQFIPTYRCDSPSYQQVQEEMKSLLKGRFDSQNKMELDSASSGIDSCSSPSNSPTRSWCSNDDSGSEESGLGIRSSSPASSSDDDDEGCYSPVYSCLSLSPTYSEGVPERPEASFSPVSSSWNETMSNQHYPHYRKCPRLDSMSHIPFLNEDEIVVPIKRSGDSIKNKSKKIVIMLNILHKTSFISPIPSSMADIVPILLSFIVRGIVSLTPQKYKYEDHSKDVEMSRLGRRSFSLAYRILKTICLNIQFFPDMVKNGTIAIVSRLLPWDKILASTGVTESISVLLETLRGKTNDTSGWREGHLLRTLLISKSEDELKNVALAIPLLFRTNDHVLRNFESKGSSWTRVFELLTKSDDIPLSLFQDCILTLATLSETIGMQYDASDVNRRPKLVQRNGAQNNDQILQFLQDSPNTDNTLEGQPANNFELDGKVKITLDDGTTALIQKQVLTESSPVFSAMFDGHFKEAGSQAVLIRNLSKASLKLFVEQLQILNPVSQSDIQQPMECGEDNSAAFSDTTDLSCLFELISLSDQFLLESLYERTLNTLLSSYICPYSAPRIYGEAVRLSALWKPQSRLQGWDMDLTFVILKYLFVGDITTSCRCAAFRKIFDAVPSNTVVGDMRALVEYYSSKRPRQIR